MGMPENGDLVLIESPQMTAGGPRWYRFLDGPDDDGTSRLQNLLTAVIEKHHIGYVIDTRHWRGVEPVYYDLAYWRIHLEKTRRDGIAHCLAITGGGQWFDDPKKMIAQDMERANR